MTTLTSLTLCPLNAPFLPLKKNHVNCGRGISKLLYFVCIFGKKKNRSNRSPNNHPHFLYGMHTSSCSVWCRKDKPVSLINRMF